MASKGSSITLTADEILKIKMKANLIPNCTWFIDLQTIKPQIVPKISTNNLWFELKSGLIIPKTWKSEKRSKDSGSSKNNNLSEEKSMSKSVAFNKKSSKKSCNGPTKSCSWTVKKYALWTASCWCRILWPKDRTKLR